jgi:hypothetical protein
VSLNDGKKPDEKNPEAKNLKQKYRATVPLIQAIYCKKIYTWPRRSLLR